MKFTHQIDKLLVLIVILLAVLVGAVESQAKPNTPPIRVLSADCSAGTSASHYNGIHVVITNDTIGATLLNTTFPVNVTFQNRFAVIPNPSTDNYHVQAWAFITDSASQDLWLVGSSGLHC